MSLSKGNHGLRGAGPGHSLVYSCHPFKRCSSQWRPGLPWRARGLPARAADRTDEEDDQSEFIKKEQCSLNYLSSIVFRVNTLTNIVLPALIAQIG